MKLKNPSQDLLKTLALGTLVLGLIAVPLVLASLKLGRLAGPAQAGLPDYGEAPAFSLTSHRNQSVSQKDLVGSVWIADFIFTRCATMCPQMTRRMKGLQSQLPGISFVSFSVDPEFDTPDILNRYARRLDAEKPRWHFLTGTREALVELGKGFKVTGANEPVFHSLSFILVDPEGKIRGYYHSGQPEELERLKKDARLLAGSRGGP